MAQDKKSTGFPDPLELDEVKKTNAYGLKVAKAIADDWFNGGKLTNECNYINRRDKIRKNRLYSRGEQNIDTYKKLMEDLNFMNIDWTPLNLAGKTIDIVVNGMPEDMYRIDISAIDKISTIERKKHKERLQKAMRTKSMLQKVKERLKLDFTPKGFIPEDDEELEMHMSLSYKPAIEIAEELAIEYVMASNNFKTLLAQAKRDMVENALGAFRVSTVAGKGITISGVNIENFIHSYVRRKDFGDCHYMGEVDTITLSEIKRLTGAKNNELRQIAQTYSTINGNEAFGVNDFESAEMNEVLDFKISIMNFAYKTTKTINYKKRHNSHGGYKMIAKDSSYDPPKHDDSEKVSKVLDTWYEGLFIIGSDYLFNYKECELLSRDTLDRALPPFVVISSDIYENSLHSLSDRMQPIIEQMQRTHLKIQQLVAMMRPDETEIDIDLLAELTTKTGKKLTWEDAVAMYNSKGIVISTRVDMGEEGIKDRKALHVPTQQQSGKLEQLTRMWIHYYNVLRDLTGVNSARDGSQPSDVLVGVQELQLHQSNTATQGITDAVLELVRKTAETVSTRLGDIFRWGDDIAEVYKNAIGVHNLDVIKSLENRHLHEFGVKIQILPTEAEMRDFKESLGIALQAGTINAMDKIKAERIAKTNVKQAEAFLEYRIKKNIKQSEETEAKRIEQQAQSNAKAAEQAEASRRQTLQFEAQIEIDKAKQLALVEVLKTAELNKINRPEKEREYEVDIFKEQLKVTGRIDEKEMSEDRKDKRQNISDTHASKMIEQRKKEEAKAIDFTQSNTNDIFADFINR